MQIFYKKHFKINVFYNVLSKIAIKTMVLFRSMTDSDKHSLDGKINKIIFISNDRDKLEQIKMKLNPVQVFLSGRLPADSTSYDRIIFDNALLPFKDIIQDFQKLRSSEISMRIIPSNTSYIIGSDSSGGKGEVLIF